MQESKEVILDGSGDGTITFSQPRTWRKRTYTKVSLFIENGQLNSGGIARVFAGESLLQNQVDGSSKPWLDTAFFNPDQVTIRSPLQLIVLFTGCFPGSKATATTEFIEE